MYITTNTIQLQCKLLPGWSPTFTPPTIISLCCSLMLWSIFVTGLVILEHNAQCSGKMHHLSEWLPQHSCHPPAHIQPSHAPPLPGLIECGKPREIKGWIVPWMACAVSSSPLLARLHRCFVTTTASPDQIRPMMCQFDMTIQFPKPERSTVSCPLSSHIQDIMKNNERANWRGRERGSANYTWSLSWFQCNLYFIQSLAWLKVNTKVNQGVAPTTKHLITLKLINS